MNIPTDKDWKNSKNGVDERSAYENFFGKDHASAILEFRNNVLGQSESLMYMPEVPFMYYMHAFLKYIIDGDFKQFFAADSASCFLCTVQRQLEKKPSHIYPLLNEIMPVVRSFAENQSSYGADVDIYGDFTCAYESILALATKLGWGL